GRLPREPHVQFRIAVDSFSGHDVRDAFELIDVIEVHVELHATGQIEQGTEACLVSGRRTFVELAAIDIHAARIDLYIDERVRSRQAPVIPRRVSQQGLDAPGIADGAILVLDMNYRSSV